MTSTLLSAADLAAGRGLDALIAEKVMGYMWARFDHPPGGWRGPNGDLLSPWRWLVLPSDRVQPALGDETPYMDNVWRYSTDIVDAWRVVEKLGVSHDLRLWQEGAHWAARFQPRDSSSMASTTTFARAAALAISRAALCAVDAAA